MSYHSLNSHHKLFLNVNKFVTKYAVKKTGDGRNLKERHNVRRLCYELA